MHSINLLFAVFLQALLVPAVIHVRQEVNTTSEASYSNHTVYTTVYNSTVTVSITHTTLATEPGSSAMPTSSTSTAATSRPTLPFTVIAIHPGTPIHQLRMNADGQRFYLGSQPSTYCPKRVQELGGCPPGDTTAFGLCAMVSPLTSWTYKRQCSPSDRRSLFQVDRRYLHSLMVSLALRRLILLSFHQDLAPVLSSMSWNTAGTNMRICSLIPPTRLGPRGFMHVRPTTAGGKCFSL